MSRGRERGDEGRVRGGLLAFRSSYSATDDTCSPAAACFLQVMHPFVVVGKMGRRSSTGRTGSEAVEVNLAEDNSIGRS
ncbi:hypothetical protein R1flu_013075 [Riccia fluitans]|uniref:Uncharacterized protein n=1 Tax=Riccia fluitans TaxID=41844 RepID=A0ABD1ZCR2_9MARC